MAFDNYLPLTKVVLPMSKNENETVAKPETKKRHMSKNDTSLETVTTEEQNDTEQKMTHWSNK